MKYWNMTNRMIHFSCLLWHWLLTESVANVIQVGSLYLKKCPIDESHINFAVS